MTAREPINLSDSTMDVIKKMAEGNPGAISVLMPILNDDPNGIMTIMSLDDMNIRGTQIWVGYKDHCNQDLAKFVQCVKDRDPAMVAKINEECIYGEHRERAVTRGASFENVAGSGHARGMGL